MEKNSNKLVILLLGIIIVILAVLCVLFVTDTIVFNSRNSETNNTTNTTTTNNNSINGDNNITNDDNSRNSETNNTTNNSTNGDNNITNDDNLKIINSVVINSIEIEKPKVVSRDGGKTIGGNISMDFDCNDERVVGLRLTGYCLDDNNNKYLIDAPRGVAAIYCKNNSSYSKNQFFEVSQIIDINNNKIDTWNLFYGENNTIVDTENFNIKYCKFDKAEYVSNDLTTLLTSNVNFEKNY